MMRRLGLLQTLSLLLLAASPPAFADEGDPGPDEAPAAATPMEESTPGEQPTPAPAAETPDAQTDPSPGPAASDPETDASTQVDEEAAAKASAEVEEPWDPKGPLLRYTSRDIDIWAKALVQGQFAMFTGDDTLLADGDPAQDPGFRLRRARIGLAGQAFERVDFEVLVGISDAGMDILDAWAGFRFVDELQLVIGVRKLPFSRFTLLSSGKQSLADRPLGVTAMAPDRQIGLTVEGDIADGMLRYSVGAWNGFERNTNFFEGYVDGIGKSGNQFNDVALAARLETSPLGPMEGDAADLRRDTSSAVLNVGASFFWNDGSTTTSLGVEGDVHLKVMGLHALMEVIWQRAEPVSDPTTPATIPADIERLAFAGEIGYVWQAMKAWPLDVGFTVRAEVIDDDMALDDNGDVLVVTGGVALYYHRHHVRLNLDFIHREELQGVALDNDTLLLQMQFAL